MVLDRMLASDRGEFNYICLYMMESDWLESVWRLEGEGPFEY